MGRRRTKREKKNSLPMETGNVFMRGTFAGYGIGILTYRNVIAIGKRRYLQRIEEMGDKGDGIKRDGISRRLGTAGQK